MPSHVLRHAVNIAGGSAKVHVALTTLGGLKGRTMAEVSGSGGVGSKWTLKYPGGPTFVWEVTVQDDHKVAPTTRPGTATRSPPRRSPGRPSRSP